MLSSILTSIECGLLFTLPIIAMHISARVLHVDDLTIEGSFGVGGALAALCITQGVNPVGALIAALIVGGCAGLATASIHTHLNQSVLMSGIIVTTALFSCNLKLAGANLSLAQHRTIFTLFCGYKAVILAGITLGAVFLCKWLLTTRAGFLLRATGENKTMLRSLGHNPASLLTLGLMLANALTALAGALMVQYVGFFSIWSNVGIMIVTLAGLMLAELIRPQIGLSLVGGAILYQLLLFTTFELQLNPDWNKCITALCIICILVVKKICTEKP